MKQVIVHIFFQELASFKILHRWRFPKLGNINPVQFIKVNIDCSIVGSLLCHR